MFNKISSIHKSESRMIPFLVSKPGTGKTAFVSQYAKENNLSLFVFNTASIDELELGGIPYRDDQNRVQYSRPTWYDVDVLFFDEIDRVSNPSVHNALLSLFRDRKLNGHEFKGLIITAGNQEHDEACNIFDSKSAFSDRLLRINFNYSEQEFKAYLTDKYPDSELRRFLCSNLDLVSPFTPRRIDEAILLGPSFLSSMLSTSVDVAYVDFLAKRISLEQYFEGVVVDKKNKMIICSLLAEAAEKIGSWIKTDKTSKINDLLKNCMPEGELAFVYAVKAQVSKNGAFLQHFSEAIHKKTYELFLKQR